MAYIFYPVPTPVFPALPGQTWSVIKKPIMSSRVVTAASGREVQLAAAVYPRWAFTLTYSVLRDQTQNITPDPTLLGFTEFEQLSAIFILCRGSYGEFYFDDPDDDSRLASLAGYGDGTTTTFTLMISWGNGPFSPSFTMPCGGINVLNAVYINGVSQAPSSYTIDSTNTAVVFNSPPAAGAAITADFSFYFRCRFLDDQLNFTQFVQNKWEAREIRFESVKP